ncbi:hypothetical protein [Arthrobacter sp. NyZ413]|uniref:hypothetical protein n=1 Tax=Arthrobacter sp. NyZ413 TaxID=3144669 RepID=UPI003BF7A259
MDENSSTAEYGTENTDSRTGRSKLPLDFAADLAIVDALYDYKQQERGNHNHRPRGSVIATTLMVTPNKADSGSQ